jgi:hypothetical protein
MPQSSFQRRVWLSLLGLALASLITTDAAAQAVDRRDGSWRLMSQPSARADRLPNRRSFQNFNAGREPGLITATTPNASGNFGGPGTGGGGGGGG